MTPIFVDTGAWFARFVPIDRDYPAACEWFAQNIHPQITTDYVIDELLTAVKVRGRFAGSGQFARSDRVLAISTQ
jgi:predicted nucleic acid-binding protein